MCFLVVITTQSHTVKASESYTVKSPQLSKMLNDKTGYAHRPEEGTGGQEVLPCPNKGSWPCFLNFPQLRDISEPNIFNVHRPST